MKGSRLDADRRSGEGRYSGFRKPYPSRFFAFFLMIDRHTSEKPPLGLADVTAWMGPVPLLSPLSLLIPVQLILCTCYIFQYHE